MLPSAVAPSRWQRAFTLLEITVVIFLIMLMVAVAVPSLSGQLARQKLQSTFDRFDAFAAQAQKRSVAENRAYTLVWVRDGSVLLYPAELTAEQRKKHGPAASFEPAGPTTDRQDHYTLVRDAALTANPATVWTFWPTGNCEPVGVRYEGPSGKWEAAYNPLSAKANLHTFLVR